MVLALVLFIIMYVLLLLFPRYRPWIALGTALVFVILQIMPLQEILGSINFNVLMMIAGTMGIVSLFIESGMPSLMADIIVDKMPNVKWTIVALALFAGIVSAFVDNVATVLMIAPVAIAIARKFEISPIAMVIAISVSSNLQGAATLVGDTTAILLGGYADMTFMDFFVFHGKAGIFWAVELGALLTAGVLLILFRKETQPTVGKDRTEVKDYVPTILLAGTVVLLIIASFIPNTPEYINGYICMTLLIIGLIWNVIKKRSLLGITKPVSEIDYETLLLLTGLFIVIGGITQAGVIDEIAKLFLKIGSGNLFVIYMLIVWVSVALSAFVDNIPYVATMLPVVQGIAAGMGVEPYVLYFGLLIGATLGGNLTPVGASANITAIGMLQREGYIVKTRDFMRIGIPFSLVAVLSGSIFVWLVWGI
ncbi:MAG: arsenic transporter [Oscillospiraceae bacterium]|nr:arsenic transporter [Oscillospiraceae bacterium]